MEQQKLVRYFDAITALNINQGTVKLMLGNHDPEKLVADAQNSTPEHTATIAMPLQAFIGALALFLNDPRNQDMVKSMQDAIEKNKTN